jgi:nucleoside-diphosphate-sugar epimerase
MTTKRYLVTGATGFMGGALVRRLSAAGHFVRCLVRDPDAAREKFAGLDLTFVTGDVTEPGTLRGAADDVDVVYHLAAIMGHDLPSPDSFARFRRVNVEGTRAVCEACAGTGIERFVYVSSTAAMGLLTDKIVREDTPVAPFTPYQVSKWEAEEVVRGFAAERALPAVIVRPSMVYGPGFRGDFLTMAKVIRTGFFPRIGLGENLSPALFIDDCAAGLVAAGDLGRPGETYLLSSEHSYPLDTAARIIAGAMGKRVHLVYVPRWLALAGAWTLERLFLLLGKSPMVTARNIRSTSTDRVFDISKAREELGFRQTVGFEEGLTRAVAWFREAGLV